MMTRATKKPAPERAGNTGLICALGALVCSGTVEGGTGMRFRMEGRLVEVGAGAAAANAVRTGRDVVGAVATRPAPTPSIRMNPSAA
jgi:hypothetical protein